MNETLTASPHVGSSGAVRTVPSTAGGESSSCKRESREGANVRGVSDPTMVSGNSAGQLISVSAPLPLTQELLMAAGCPAKDSAVTTNSNIIGSRNALPSTIFRGVTPTTKTGSRPKRGKSSRSDQQRAKHQTHELTLPRAVSETLPMTSSPRSGLSVHDNVPMETYIAKKRETGLVRLSLATKKSEIQRLEMEMDRAEKKLRQQQDQLESTREKFNNFLKHSNLEQDAAVRRADDESKAKEEKIFEIKELCALIGSTEDKIKKMTIRLENCQMYKRFLDDLTKPRWFYDLLVKLRVEDESQQIIAEAESRFAQRCEAAIRDAEGRANHMSEEEQTGRDSALVSAAKSKLDEGSLPLLPPRGNAPAAAPRATTTDTASRVKAGGATPTTTTTATGVAHMFDTPARMEEQFDMLHKETMQEAQSAVDALVERVTSEVEEMTVEQVKEVIQKNYPDSRVPCYFSEVDQLLEVFINVEEGNLFLIQNCQELEEELENVTMDFMTEHEDMLMMTRQRHAQMATLAEKIHVAKTKLEELEERGAMLGEIPAQPSAGNGNAENLLHGSKKNKSDVKSSQGNNMSPETLKVFVEQSIATIFRSLTAGDSTIKSLNSSNSADPSRADNATSGAAYDSRANMTKRHSNERSVQQGAGGDLDGIGGAASNGEDYDDQRRKIVDHARTDADYTSAASTRADAAPKKPKLRRPARGVHNQRPYSTTNHGKIQGHRGAGGRVLTQDGGGATAKTPGALSKMSGGSSAVGSNTMSTPIGSSGGDGAGTSNAANASNETGANMSPVDMLTIIENKLEEYHRYIFDPATGVDDAVIRNVMKSKDKQRRRIARLEHMAQQAANQEERMQRALARAQASVVKRQGKPVFLRSHIVKDEERGSISHSSMNKMEDEGMEFFQ